MKFDSMRFVKDQAEQMDVIELSLAELATVSGGGSCPGSNGIPYGIDQGYGYNYGSSPCQQGPGYNYGSSPYQQGPGYNYGSSPCQQGYGYNYGDPGYNQSSPCMTVSLQSSCSY